MDSGLSKCRYIINGGIDAPWIVSVHVDVLMFYN